MPRLRVLLAALSLTTLALAACDSSPSVPEIAPNFAKPGDGGPITVEATDPTGAPQDTTLDVRVFGSGFESRSQANFLLAGKPTPNMQTNRTLFVSPTELVANITIALDAEVALYDVEVRSGNGRRRGIGTELFGVVQKITGPDHGDVITTLADAEGDGLLSDGAPYVPGGRGKKKALGSSISQFGQHGLTIREGTGRELCLVFPEEGPDAEIVSTSDWNDLVTTSGGAVGLGVTYCGIGGFFTRDHGEPDKLLGMDVDPATARDNVQTAGVSLILEEFDESGAWDWRLYFDDFLSPVNGGAIGNGVCIRFDGDGQWTIGTDVAIAAGTEQPELCAEELVDQYANLLRNTETEGFKYVARFRMPFSYTIQRIY